MTHLDAAGEALIWAGSILFTIALVPQGIRTIRLGRADDLSVVFILMVLGASGATLVYWLLHDQPFRVWFGFVANLIVWGLVLWYRIFPRPGSIGHEDKPARRSTPKPEATDAPTRPGAGLVAIATVWSVALLERAWSRMRRR